MTGMVEEEHRSEGVSIRWWPRSPSASRHDQRAETDAAVLRHLHEVFGTVDVRVGRLCPTCGADDHGRPRVRVEGEPVAVSWSRSGRHLLTAVHRADDVSRGSSSVSVSLGVDVERVSDVAARVTPGLIRHVGDPPLTTSELTGPDSGGRAALDLARLWVAKEAILKAEGVGLRRPMTDVPVRDYPVRPIPARQGFVAAYVLLANGHRFA